MREPCIKDAEESRSCKDKKTVSRKHVLGCEKPWEEDAVDVVMELSFIWHRYNVWGFFSFFLCCG